MCLNGVIAQVIFGDSIWLEGDDELFYIEGTDTFYYPISLPDFIAREAGMNGDEVRDIFLAQDSILNDDNIPDSDKKQAIIKWWLDNREKLSINFYACSMNA
jgi:hypothetical protein